MRQVKICFVDGSESHGKNNDVGFIFQEGDAYFFCTTAGVLESNTSFNSLLKTIAELNYGVLSVTPDSSDEPIQICKCEVNR